MVESMDEDPDWVCDDCEFDAEEDTTNGIVTRFATVSNYFVCDRSALQTCVEACWFKEVLHKNKNTVVHENKKYLRNNTDAIIHGFLSLTSSCLVEKENHS